MWGKPSTIEPTIQCSLVKAPTIYIENTPRQKIQLLMNEYTHQEWLAYLTGKISEKENIFVGDIVVPPHESATGASAEAEPFHIPENCVGIIHSHHGMGAFHSGTDQSYVDKNFPVSIVVSRNKTDFVYDAVSYTQTPCGKNLTLKCDVKYVQPPPTFDKDVFLKEAKENIDKGKIAYVPRLQERQPLYTHRPLNAPYVPVRFRFPYYTDEHGHVLSKKELEALDYW